VHPGLFGESITGLLKKIRSATGIRTDLALKLGKAAGTALENSVTGQPIQKQIFSINHLKDFEFV